MSFEKLLTVLDIFKIVMAADHLSGLNAPYTVMAKRLLRWQDTLEFVLARSEEQILHHHGSTVTLGQWPKDLKRVFNFAKWWQISKSSEVRLHYWNFPTSPHVTVTTISLFIGSKYHAIHTPQPLFTSRKPNSFNCWQNYADTRGVHLITIHEVRKTVKIF